MCPSTVEGLPLSSGRECISAERGSHGLEIQIAGVYLTLHTPFMNYAQRSRELNKPQTNSKQTAPALRQGLQETQNRRGDLKDKVVLSAEPLVNQPRRRRPSPARPRRAKAPGAGMLFTEKAALVKSVPFALKSLVPE